MIARTVLVLVLSGGLGAPFQCASDPDPDRRTQDTPSEALWDMAEEFRAAGETPARERVLRQIVERYPDSSEAEMARMALEGREPPPPAEASEGDEE